MRFLRVIAWTACGLMCAWAALLLAMTPGLSLAMGSAAVLVPIPAGLLLARRFVASRWRLPAFIAVPGLVVIGWFFAVRPSGSRTWIAGQERSPQVAIAGDFVTIENVRNATWRSATDVDMRWETRRYDLRAVRTVDLVIEPFDDWRGLAHIFVTFGFEGGEHVAVSIESRREVGEAYSPMRGAFRHYEMLYIIGDERDLIGLRANIRRDPVYVFPTRARPEEARALFVAMITRGHELGECPEFYNTVTTTCATSLLRHVNAQRTHQVSLLDWRIMFPGYADELAWDLGLMHMGGTLEEARARHLINDRSAFDPALDGPAWSRKIRGPQAPAD